jgi:hypothetical protein
MKRIAGIAAAMLLATLFLVPVALAADPTLPHTGRVLVSVDGDVTLPVGEHADVVVIVGGTATVLGEVNTIVAVDGTANLIGARAESIVAIRSQVALGPNTVVLGDVSTLDTTVQRDASASIGGTISDLSGDIAAFALFLGAFSLLFWLGLGLATIVAALVLAGIAARQVRTAEGVISHEPGTTFLVGLAGLIVAPILAIILMATVIGIPLGLGVLMLVWPVTAFVGYLVAAIWVGDFVMRRVSPQRPAERPYLASVVGVVILTIVGFVPLVSLIATVFGLGAVILLAWRSFRGDRELSAPTPQHAPAPLAT